MSTDQTLYAPEDQIAETQSLLRDALGKYEPGRIAISFSGAEDVVLIDLVASMGLSAAVFSLDTGRLHAQTYEFIERVRKHYDISIELLSPNPEALGQLVKDKGLFSFYEDGHGECCGIRKIAPLRSKLGTLDAWITGQRRDQSVTRTDVPLRQVDTAFSTSEHSIEKYNPLANWSASQIWHYIRDFEVPYNALHDEGYTSIGCQPCTRATGPHQHERAGRWWWEEETQKECGLHHQNVISIKILPN
jgi:phosphoadenosine phosphosulfate reductase